MRQQKANELMAHTYSHLYGLPQQGCAFTVYGPWGRPDMAPMLFARAILAGEPIKVFNHTARCSGITPTSTTSLRECCVAAISRPRPMLLLIRFSRIPHGSGTHRVFNIGNSQPIELFHRGNGTGPRSGSYQGLSRRCSPVMWRPLLRIPRP